MLGQALGLLCEATAEDPFAETAPDAAALAAVAAVGSAALTVGCATVPMLPAELAFERALHLAQALARAGRDELWDEPGRAEWSEWLMTLVGSASDAVDAATNCHPVLATDAVAVHEEHWLTASEQLEAASGALVTTCVQVLALFPPDRGRSRGNA